VEKKYIKESLVLLLAGVHFWLARDIPFFWDSIQLSSKQAHYFLESGFVSFSLPDELDSGHPPLVGWYLAMMWQLLGRSLWVSHLAFLPFVALYLFFGLQWVQHLVKPLWGRVLGGVILFSDPLFLTQSIIMGPDIILISSFMAIVYAYCKGQKVMMVAMSLILGLVSMRGAMVLAAFGFFHLVNTFWFHRKGWSYLFIRGWPLLPGAAAFLVFLYWHYLTKGWIGFHSGSPWAESFQMVDFLGFLKNIAILGFRFNEFGRFIICIPLLFFLYKFRNQLIPLQYKGFTLFVILALLVLPNTLIYAHLSANRYFWPLYLLASLGLISFIGASKLETHYLKGLAATAAAIFLASHLWIYPWKTSQDWESTLVHLPYHEVRSKIYDFYTASGIAPSSVGTSFPAVNSNYHINLQEFKDSPPKAMEIGVDPYIFYSNIMNSVKSTDLQQIDSLYWPRYFIQKDRIRGYLYELKE